MPQTADEVLDDLRKFVAGRGRDDNFCYSKVYSPSSDIKCIDFSPWVGRRVLMNDTFALAVFQVQLTKDHIVGTSISVTMEGEGETLTYDDENESDYHDIDDIEHEDNSDVSYDEEAKWQEEEIIKIIQFPFDEYFTGETKLAKIDLIVSWLLNYSYEHYPRIVMAYDLSLNNAQLYLEKYNELKKTQLELPPHLPDNAKFNEFRNELRKMPLATRLHLFDVLSYSGFSKSNKKPKLRLISDMTLYDTRKVGVDEHESANILRQSKLIVSSPDGTGYINPEYIEVISIAAGYTKEMVPAYREWQTDVSDKLFGFEDLEDDLFDEQEDE
jgi:hypothetical protein